MQQITSKENQIIKHIIKLKEKKYRKEYNEYIIEGAKIVQEAIQEKAKIKQIIISENSINTELIQKHLKEELKKVFKQYYGKFVFFEHGALSCSAKGGCCSDHAHLHIVAVDIDVKDEFSKYGYKLRKIEDYSEIIDQKQRNTPYLYYENQKISGCNYGFNNSCSNSGFGVCGRRCCVGS